MLWIILFNENRDILLLSRDEKSAMDLLSRVKFAYEKLPLWLQQGIARWDATKIELENKSSITASATTVNAGRSGSYYLVFLDEFAFVRGTMAEEFFTSVTPTISSGKQTKMVIVSTPNGMNLFYRLFINAEKKRNTFKPLSYDWTVVPNRDAEWARKEIMTIGQDKFDQEYNVLFLGSSNTLISPSALKDIIYDEPIHQKEHLDIWEYPVPKHKYIVNVDTAEGVGLDYSAFTVIDVTEKPYKLVAKYRHNKESILTYPNLIYSVARNYNMAYVLVEVNSIGIQVANTLFYQFNYENMFHTHVEPGRLGQRAILGSGKNRKLGLRITQATKRIGCANLKDIIESKQLIIKDFDIVVELSNFIKKGESFQAKEGETDDLVMTLVLFAWLAKQELFEEMTNTSIQRNHKQEEVKEHLPFPIRYNYAEYCDQMGYDGFIDDSGTVWESVNYNNLPFGYRQ